MNQIITVHPDGTTESREPTTDELNQAQLDQQTIVDVEWNKLRAERNQRLAACDWTVLSDTPTSTAAWKTYRQALRDLPANTNDPFNPVWPTPPA